MYLYQLGWNWKHSADLKIERPNGHFGMQLIVVRTRGRLRMGGAEYRVKPNTAFLVQSCLPHCIYADGEPYADDWIRFSPEQDDHEFLDNLRVRWNEPIQLPDDSVSKMIAAAESVSKSDLPDKHVILHHMMIAMLLFIEGCDAPRSNEKKNYYDSQLEELRKQIYDNPDRDWNIPEIADTLSISVSHFQRLYKQRYGISCTNDIFMSRMEYAKQLLIETDLSANEIAFRCGYRSYAHFSRSFTKYACDPPAKYRQMHQAAPSSEAQAASAADAAAD